MIEDGKSIVAREVTGHIEEVTLMGGRWIARVCGRKKSLGKVKRV